MEPKKLVFKVENDSTLNETLKKILSRRYYRFIKHNDCEILVDGLKRKGFEKVSSGETIEIFIPEIQKEVFWPITDKLPTILYEDDNYIIVDKEPNLLTIPTKADPHSLYQQLIAYLKTSDIHILNRLDKQTSGLIVVAKNRYAASLLQPTHEHITRKYICLVEGIVNEDGTISNYIAKDENSNKRYIGDMTNGKLAISHYKVLKKYEDKTLLEFILETGRTHQIRVHTSSMGHPIIGDTFYGGKENTYFYLRSYAVEFKNPFTNELVSVVTGSDFKDGRRKEN